MKTLQVKRSKNEHHLGFFSLSGCRIRSLFRRLGFWVLRRRHGCWYIYLIITFTYVNLYPVLTHLFYVVFRILVQLISFHTSICELISIGTMAKLFVTKPFELPSPSRLVVLFSLDVEGAVCCDREGPLHLCRGVEAPSDGGVATMKGFGMVVVTKSPSVTAWELSMDFSNSHPSGFGLITLFSQKVSVPCFALHPQFSKKDLGPEGKSNFNKSSYWNQHDVRTFVVQSGTDRILLLAHFIFIIFLFLSTVA